MSLMKNVGIKDVTVPLFSFIKFAQPSLSAVGEFRSPVTLSFL